LKSKEEVILNELNNNFYYIKPSRQTYGIEYHPSLESYEIKTDIEIYEYKIYPIDNNIISIPAPTTMILLALFVIYGKFKRR